MYEYWWIITGTPYERYGVTRSLIQQLTPKKTSTLASLPLWGYPPGGYPAVAGKFPLTKFSNAGSASMSCWEVLYTCELIINVVQWRHMATKVWVITRSGNDLLADSTKPLPQPVLTNHQSGLVPFIWWHYQEKIWRYQAVKQDWKSHF